MNKRKSLGRGLDALLSSARPAAPAPPTEPADPTAVPPSPPETGLREVPVDLLRRGKYQPRVDMREDSLTELAESIKAQGVVQPIVVRPLPNPTGGETEYEIVAGERRWRAAQMAGLATIPAVIRDIPDESAVAVALIENIQRENLNPLEEARSLHRLVEEFGLTHADAAEAVGRSRATVTNLLRLLELPRPVREMLERRELDMGHARALLGARLAGADRSDRRAGPQAAVERARDRGSRPQARRAAERREGAQGGGAGRRIPTCAGSKRISPRRSAPPSRSSTARRAGAS